MVSNSKIAQTIIITIKILSYAFLVYVYVGSWPKLLILGLFMLLNGMALSFTSFKDPGYVKPSRFANFELSEVVLNDGLVIRINVHNELREVVDCNSSMSRAELDHRGNWYFVGDLFDDVDELDKLKMMPGKKSHEIVWYQKYCDDCNLFRAPGVSHCWDCGHCVLDKDHHCPSLDNCIGRNNLRPFMVFILSDLVLNTLIAIKMQLMLFGSSPMNITSFKSILGHVSSKCIFLVPLGDLILVCKFYYISAIDLRARDWHLKTRMGRLNILEWPKRLLTFRTPIYSI
ncbi:ERFB [Enterospora canceri]|uniref:Palmitoyltransferase n=1 Tax=Enterospora canceri TaxID=1081671 RepID=A0A1Y1S6R4_9MICR|nr:ERFB [Enterospora canceri]